MRFPRTHAVTPAHVYRTLLVAVLPFIYRSSGYTTPALHVRLPHTHICWFALHVTAALPAVWLHCGCRVRTAHAVAHCLRLCSSYIALRTGSAHHMPRTVYAPAFWLRTFPHAVYCRLDTGWFGYVLARRTLCYAFWLHYAHCRFTFYGYRVTHICPYAPAFIPLHTLRFRAVTCGCVYVPFLPPTFCYWFGCYCYALHFALRWLVTHTTYPHTHTPHTQVWLRITLCLHTWFTVGLVHIPYTATPARLLRLLLPRTVPALVYRTHHRIAVALRGLHTRTVAATPPHAFLRCLVCRTVPARLRTHAHTFCRCGYAFLVTAHGLPPTDYLVYHIPAVPLPHSFAYTLHTVTGCTPRRSHAAAWFPYCWLHFTACRGCVYRLPFLRLPFCRHTLFMSRLRLLPHYRSATVVPGSAAGYLRLHWFTAPRIRCAVTWLFALLRTFTFTYTHWLRYRYRFIAWLPTALVTFYTPRFVTFCRLLVVAAVARFPRCTHTLPTFVYRVYGSLPLVYIHHDFLHVTFTRRLLAVGPTAIHYMVIYVYHLPVGYYGCCRYVGLYTRTVTPVLHTGSRFYRSVRLYATVTHVYAYHAFLRSRYAHGLRLHSLFYRFIALPTPLVRTFGCRYTPAVYHHRTPHTRCCATYGLLLPHYGSATFLPHLRFWFYGSRTRGLRFVGCCLPLRVRFRIRLPVAAFTFVPVLPHTLRTVVHTTHTRSHTTFTCATVPPRLRTPAARLVLRFAVQF